MLRVGRFGMLDALSVFLSERSLPVTVGVTNGDRSSH